MVRGEDGSPSHCGQLLGYTSDRAAVVVEGATVTIIVTEATTMLVIGLILSMFGIGLFCWLIFTLTVYALPFFALCGRPHNANYVAFYDMWRGRGERFCGAQ